VQQALRRVMPPLLVLAALVALDTVRLEWAGALEHSQAIAVSALVGDALLQFIMLTVSAMVTVPALVLLAIGLSRGRHAAFLPSIGAGVLVGLQPVLAYCSSFPLAAQLTDKASPLVPIAACLLISLPILAALLAVSESQSGLRSLLLVGLPAVWMGSQVLPGDFIARWLRLDFTGPLTPLIACSYLTPLNCSGWLTYVVDGFLQPRDMLPVWLCQLPFQLALLFLAAWFALRAISLRKRGAA